jgi:hypothetical protein
LSFCWACRLARSCAAAFHAGPRHACSSAPAITGTVSTQGDIVLGGALVSLLNRDGEVASLRSDGEVPSSSTPSRSVPIRLSWRSTAFDTLTLPVTVVGGQAVTLKADLRIAAVSGAGGRGGDNDRAGAPTGTLATSDALTGKELDEITGGGGFQSALRLAGQRHRSPLAASVSRDPAVAGLRATGVRRLRRSGDRPLGLASPTMRSTPVTVLPNPHRRRARPFLVGLVLCLYRRAGDRWKTRLNNLDPCSRTKRGSPINITGISAFSPRAEMVGRSSRTSCSCSRRCSIATAPTMCRAGRRTN